MAYTKETTTTTTAEGAAVERAVGIERKQQQRRTITIVCFILIGQTLLTSMSNNIRSISEFQTKTTKDLTSSTVPTQSSSVSSSLHLNPLDIPVGAALNLPSIRHNDSQVNAKREGTTVYGGKGDGKHLGGFTDIDIQGLSPSVWKHLVQNWTVQSVLDVGCGRGTSTSWFYTHGLRTQCVEGSHDAIEQSMLPDKSLIVEHDFSRGPWWPEETFDAVWSVEFLEHVNVHNHYNYISTFRKAAILLVTSSRWGGWHHVEVHQDDWWIRKYEAYGFKYDPILTKEIRQVAAAENKKGALFPPTNQKYNPQHIFVSMKVFINPVVAALPQHAHLFTEFGCFNGNTKKRRECGGVQDTKQLETSLDPSYYPYPLTPAQDEAWYQIVTANIPPQQE